MFIGIESTYSFTTWKREQVKTELTLPNHFDLALIISIVVTVRGFEKSSLGEKIETKKVFVWTQITEIYGDQNSEPWSIGILTPIKTEMRCSSENHGGHENHCTNRFQGWFPTDTWKAIQFPHGEQLCTGKWGQRSASRPTCSRNSYLGNIFGKVWTVACFLKVIKQEKSSRNIHVLGLPQRFRSTILVAFEHKPNMYQFLNAWNRL